VGKLRVQQELLEEAFAWGSTPISRSIRSRTRADYRTVQYILERAEFVPRYERFRKWEERLGDVGFVIPYLHRIPFQQALIDYVGEIELFYTLNDNPKPVQKLMDALHEQMLDVIASLAKFPAVYVEFIDSLTGHLTNPRLFEELCLPQAFRLGPCALTKWTSAAQW
jgi:hypothetical protein